MAILGVATAGLELGVHGCRALLNGGQMVTDVPRDGTEPLSTAASAVLAAGRNALAAAARRCGNSPTAQVEVQSLVCAVPYEDWRDASVVQQIRSSLRGRSRGTLNNEPGLQVNLSDGQVIPHGLAAIFAQAYGLVGEERIVVQREELLHQVVGVIDVTGQTVTCLIFNTGLQLSERFTRVRSREADVARQVLDLISEYRNLLNVQAFAVVGSGAREVAPTVVASAGGVQVPSEPEWANAAGARLFAAMRLRMLRQRLGGGERPCPNGGLNT